MHTPQDVPGGRRLKYRGGAAVAVLAAIGLLTATGGVALAAPQATVAQVQKKLTALNARADKLDEQYDQVKQELQAASQRLAIVNREAARYSRQFQSMRAEIGQIAAQAYEQGSLNSSVALLTSGNPQQILNQSSILLELSSANSAEMQQFLAAARQLTGTQQAARHTRAGIVQLRGSLVRQRATLNKLIGQQKTLLAQLTPVQQAATGAGGGSASTTIGKYKGPTSTQAEKAVAFAYDQLGCPYVYGGTGPCSDGFDCSGLTMEAWASAGVAIPRTSYEQWDDLTHVSTSSLEPGDILVFSGAGHVGIYVGGNELIDAPHTGADVEKVALSGWYLSELDGAVRP